MANRRATAIAKTDGAKLTAELVGAAVEGSDVAWLTEEEVIAEGAEVLVEEAVMDEVGETVMDVVDALV